MSREHFAALEQLMESPIPSPESPPSTPELPQSIEGALIQSLLSGVLRGSTPTTSIPITRNNEADTASGDGDRFWGPLMHCIAAGVRTGGGGGGNVAKAPSRALTETQIKNVRSAFSIVGCDTHVDKFIRILSERDAPIDQSGDPELVQTMYGLLSFFFTEIDVSVMSRLARILALSL